MAKRKANPTPTRAAVRGENPSTMAAYVSICVRYR